MLKYLVLVTENTAVLGVLLGLLYAYVFAGFKQKGRYILTLGAGAGLAAAIARAILKNATKVIDNTGGVGMWNVRIFAVSTVVLLLYYIFSYPQLRRKMGTKGEWLPPVLTSVLAFTFVFYALPEVLAYPFQFNLNGESVFSTAFFYRLIGYFLGLLLSLLLALAVYHTAKRLELRLMSRILNLVLFINGFQQVAKAVQVLHARRLVKGRAFFLLARYAANLSDWFIYVVLMVAFIVPLLLWLRSFRVQEPYTNPAEHRKIRAKWLNIRRWSTTLTLCFALVVLTLTFFRMWDNKVVALSPIEECEQRDNNMYISLDQVEDGRLHRFAYTTENGVTVRFIVIKKPNSSAYGIGLDACDICGETGYYERNGQVVCNLCDVVMNINTIGFKGGCNPIVIDYSISDGYIIVPIETLIKHEKTFKK